MNPVTSAAAVPVRSRMLALGRLTLGAALASMIAVAAPVRAACVDSGAAEMILRAWRDREVVRGLPADLTMSRAECIRDELVAKLEADAGRVIGYKAGLTSGAVQRRFGHDAPVRGVLLARMVRLEGAGAVTAHFGARPIAEADLLVEVGDEAINEARDHLGVLKALRRVIPFIELPDLMLAEGERIDGAAITAINVGARLGIRSAEGVVVDPSPGFADRLGAMRVLVTDGAGKVLAEAPAGAILGHPLNAVLWLVEDLKRAGVRLRPGDLLSLGSFAAPIRPAPGMELTVRYGGLPGNPAITVRFD